MWFSSVRSGKVRARKQAQLRGVPFTSLMTQPLFLLSRPEGQDAFCSANASVTFEIAPLFQHVTSCSLKNSNLLNKSN